MNALKTVTSQVQEFGRYIRTDEYKDMKADVYFMDTVTNAYIWKDNKNRIHTVTFQYSMR